MVGVPPARAWYRKARSVEGGEGAVATLRALRVKGVRIALDDCGTGYSALGYLRRFPFDTLKIDRSFVSEIHRDSESRALVETILAMSRVLGMTAVAEGVERPEEVEMLRALKRELTILLVEHDMEAVFALADRITVLVYGRVIASGSPDAIRANDDVREAYLGETEGTHG